MNEIARMVDVSFGIPSRWLYGDQKPQLRYLIAFERMFDIPMEAWAERPRKAFVVPALRKVPAKAHRPQVEGIRIKRSKRSSTAKSAA